VPSHAHFFEFFCRLMKRIVDARDIMILILFVLECGDENFLCAQDVKVVEKYRGNSALDSDMELVSPWVL
jgi:hypothetical protein